MSALRGTGALLTWMDVQPDHEVEFNQWLTFDHVPERLSVPDFNRARRFVAVDPAAAGRYFNFYETTDVHALASPAYLARLAVRSEWTSRIIGRLTAVSRTACSLLFSVGTGSAGLAGCVSFEVADDAAFQEVAAVLDQLVSGYQVLTAHVFRAEPDVTNADSPSREGRVDQTSKQGCVLVLELPDPRTQDKVTAAIESLQLKTSEGEPATLTYFRLLMESVSG